MTPCTCRPTEPGRIASMRLCPEGERLMARLFEAVTGNTPDLDERRAAYLEHVTQAADVDVAMERKGESDAA